LDERKFIATKIEEQEKILSNARKRFMTEEIDAEDFKAIKIGCSEQLKRLDAKLSELPAKSDGLKTVEGLLDVLLERYSDIKSKYKGASLEDKLNIIGSMSPKTCSLTRHNIEPLI
jgi:site-specific DNA recombinase